MKLGICIFGDSLPLAEVGRLAGVAEASGGFESVWTGEYWHSGFQAAASIARATSRVRVATGVVQAFPRTPLITALEALDVDDLAGGRFVLGIGPQVQRYNERLHGIEYGKPVARMREYVKALRTLWGLAAGESPVLPRGEYYGFDLTGFVRPAPAPRTAIPIHISAVRPFMTRLAGECADGMVGHPMSCERDLDDYEEWLAEGAARVGRDVSEVEHVQFVICSVAADEAQARREAAQQVALYASTQTYAYRLEQLGFAEERAAIRAAYQVRDLEGMVRAVSARVLDAFAVAGTADVVRDRIRQRARPGHTTVLAPPTYGVGADRVCELTEDLVRLFSTR
ncbi:MAG: LLM class flavin-dependent oxidoreductase [Candidatus Dormibacterales bacterium]